MKLPKKFNGMREFSIERIWTIGIICFFIIAIMGIISLWMNWGALRWYHKTSSVFTIIFQFSLCYLFYWLLKENNKKDLDEIAKQLESDEELIKIIENMKIKESMKGGKQKNG